MVSRPVYKDSVCKAQSQAIRSARVLAGDPAVRDGGCTGRLCGREGSAEQQWPGRARDSPTGPEAPTASPRWERVQLSREGRSLGRSALAAFEPGSRKPEIRGRERVSPPPPGRAPPPLLKQARPWKTSEHGGSPIRVPPIS